MKRNVIGLTINEEQRELQIPPTQRLVDILREDLGLTGTKLACGIGRCGACTVLVDGVPVNSCLVMAYQVEGTKITTIEGLQQQDLHPVQKAFLEEGGFQCGYCTPGMILAVAQLLAESPNPTQEQILEALSGNLCRCTGYGGILRAVQHAAKDITSP